MLLCLNKAFYFLRYLRDLVAARGSFCQTPSPSFSCKHGNLKYFQFRFVVIV
nr:MAG TPA: hypothetical protein [Caudoviricetes sp.]DAY03824.1 MAG TPA: hypothetical protein [Caudoviricetes sp.]